MQIHLRRVAAVLATSVALTGGSVAAASADHGHGQDGQSSPVKVEKSQTRQLLKDIAGKDKRLARLVTAERTTALADDVEAVVVANITADRATLTALAEQANAGTLDARQARRDLRSFRVENYELAINLLRKAAKVGARATAANNAEASALVASAVTKALAVTAASDRAAVKAAKADLKAAKALLEATSTSPDSPETGDDNGTDPTS